MPHVRYKLCVIDTFFPLRTREALGCYVVYLSRERKLRFEMNTLVACCFIYRRVAKLAFSLNFTPHRANKPFGEFFSLCARLIIIVGCMLTVTESY